MQMESVPLYTHLLYAQTAETNVAPNQLITIWNVPIAMNQDKKEVDMDSQTKEVMDILQEECAEVIQAISKISRFGLDNFKPGKPKTNREHLEEELGDVYAMIEILQELDIVSWTNIEQAAEAKREKLKQWSNIFSKENV
jgi:NTP pyrophosphatase (non-canonical NTP hydrolase)